MKVDYGKLRHFCDDPVCPDTVWKLSVKVQSLDFGKRLKVVSKTGEPERLAESCRNSDV